MAMPPEGKQMSLFEKGRPKTGGRMKGTRNKLSVCFVEALAKDFEQHGEDVIRIVRVEHPNEYIKVVASLLPKEFEITDSRLHDISDEELDVFIEAAKRQLASSSAGDADKREAETTH